ncbi:hypothetical protein DFR50_1087 [Roseiarcus fermentans]|uniref:Uncharacterized protein n=1 Tax=Roseiarcus fermentans TaxID=1473586 RepID=A0A366FLK0_9HYPH|nr:hypothetical protein [Roseiarcus fermentans]RBP15451.1 hypothetical protein DFR50_1087 [Roseiarcus fermentans]
MNRTGFAPPVEKASPDDPKHPGWPKGEPNGRGGQFRPKGDGDSPEGGQNGGPGDGKTGASLQAGGRALAEVIKTGIRGLIAAGMNARDNGRLVVLLAEVGLDARPYISAYFDPPKTLQALQRAAQGPRETGYEDHHIVEQATANPDGSERALMDSPDNLARIPAAKHWDLNRWYETRREQFDDLTPRQYLRGKSWEERRRVGLRGLQYVGVLK